MLVEESLDGQSPVDFWRLDCSLEQSLEMVAVMFSSLVFLRHLGTPLTPP